VTQEQIYHNIAQRTGGDIYLGVVGPVRSGKSTFIFFPNSDRISHENTCGQMY